MKKQFALLFFLAFFLFTCLQVNGQNYNSALGLRLGSPWAVSYKKFVSAGNAVEVYGAFRNYNHYNWFSINAAYQVHRDIQGINNLQWYIGAGGGLYFWTFDDILFPNGVERPSSTTFAIQGYLGLEYTFDDVPISISADWVPTLFLNGYGDSFNAGYGAVAVRYVLGR